MPKKRNGEIPLPEGWDFARDYDGKVYFIDHNSKKTTWIDPRDRFTKPQSFADCIGNELPLGWEEALDGQIGPYYINHVNQCTQLEDPRQEWRAIQEDMLRDYLQTAQDVLEAKKDIYHIKSQRLVLAQDEYDHLNNALTTLTTSRTSLCSSTSSVSTKYDPDLLKSDVSMAKNRVSRLKSELEQIKTEMNYTQRGLETLTNVEQKLSSYQGTCYNITEAQAIMTELRNIQKSLSSGEKERAELMQSLAKLKDDLTRLQLCESSPDVSTLSLPQEKLSTASQTDLSCDLVPIGTRLAEMAKMRLVYDEARKDVQYIQQKLADLEEKVQPGQVESDKDRLLLFQEKEQLLRELRSITPRTRSKEEMTDIHIKCKRLEDDLNKALEMSNRAIADRLRLHEEKQLLLSKLRDALRSMTQLESQLKTLSVSTLSVSSSSSLGSLSTTSSKGSLSSGLSFTDIYGGPQCTGSANVDKPVDMVDLHRRVELLLKGSDNISASSTMTRSQPSLSPRSSLSSVSPPFSPMYENLPCILMPPLPPPTYEQIERDRFTYSRNSHHPPLNEFMPIPSLSPLTDLLETHVNNMSQGSGLGRPFRNSYESDQILSPISETPASAPEIPMYLDDVLVSGAALSRTSSSSTNTRSVSAAVSDESVAGDSGVFEASIRKKPSGLFETDDTAQVQIKLRYIQDERLLHVCIVRARNLCALVIPTNSEVFIKAILLPNSPSSICCTKPVQDLKKPTFGDLFNMSVPLSKIYTKTLQINVLSKCENNQEKCVGYAQVSLADFNPETVSEKWYNILSQHVIDVNEEISHAKQESDVSIYKERHETDITGFHRPHANTKEESSDDSTIISSQTSTLTRNQDCEPTTLNLDFEELVNCLRSNDEYNSDNTDDEDKEDCDEEDEEGVVAEFRPNDKLEAVLEDCCDLHDHEECLEFSDAQTNTECAFYPEHAKQMKQLAAASVSVKGTIKRSQTFSPSAAVSRNYICKLNRSDSDSAMPLYRKAGGMPFQRNAVERRSLRFRRTLSCSSSGDAAIMNKTQHLHLPTTARTSIDLELDLQAQHTRLHVLNSDLNRLRTLKQRLETAREQGDSELATWVLEDQQFQNLVAQAESDRLSKTVEERKVDKMLKRVSKEIYKLRKTKAGNGKPDVISFKEKMAFFTRVNSNVPFLPSDQCHSDINRLQKSDETIDQQENCKEVRDNADGIECSTNKELNINPKYKYVVDRVLGVEV